MQNLIIINRTQDQSIRVRPSPCDVARLISVVGWSASAKHCYNEMNEADRAECKMRLEGRLL